MTAASGWTMGTAMCLSDNVKTPHPAEAIFKELTVLSPILVKTQKEVAEMMVATTKDKASAADTKAKVEVEEAKANVKAAEAKAIADDAQKDLAEAIPALEEAVKCLNDLKKSDID